MIIDSGVLEEKLSRCNPFLNPDSDIPADHEEIHGGPPPTLSSE